MAMFVTIGTVDMDGFNGRDHHPELEDAGTEFAVMTVETFEVGCENEGPQGIDTFARFGADEHADSHGDTYNLFHCVTVGGTRKVTFVEYEISGVRFA